MYINLSNVYVNYDSYIFDMIRHILHYTVLVVWNNINVYVKVYSSTRTLYNHNSNKGINSKP